MSAGGSAPDHRPDGGDRSRARRVRDAGAMRLAAVGGAATLLASLCLTPLFLRSSPWFARSVLVVAGVVGIGIGLRAVRAGARRVPAGLAVLVQLLFVGWCWLRMTAADTFDGGILPTGASFAVNAEHASAALEKMNTYAAPIPDDHDVVVLTVVMIGVLAVAVDLAAASLQRAAWAGLPLLGVYGIPSAVLPTGLGVVAFLAPAIGFLLVLATDGSLRIRSWGSAIGLGSRRRDHQRDGAEPGSGSRHLDDPVDDVRVPLLGPTGRRVGFAALALAIAVPILIPDLPQHIPSSGADETGAGNGRVIAVADPVVDLNRDLRRGRNIDLFSYTSTTPTGKRVAPDYIRTVVLDAFDGRAWRPSPRTVPSQNAVTGNVGLPQPPGWVSASDSAGDRYRFDIGGDYSSTWLPLTYPASRIGIGGDWRFDASTLDVVAATNGLTTSGATYTEEQVAVTVEPDRLRDAGPATSDIAIRYTAMPDRMPAEFTRAMRQAIGGSTQSKYDTALAIQQYFRTKFAYSLAREPGNGTAALVSFLSDRRGYCEQVAASMALMARTQGIPARVAIGFLPGERESDGSYTVRSHDAHAWPELYFAGTGWVRFEPTPSARTGRAPAWASPAQLNQGADNAGDGARSTPTPTVEPSTGVVAPSEPADRTAAGGFVDTTPRWRTPLVVALIVLALLMLAAPATVRLVRRRRRLAAGQPAGEAVENAWAELLDTARDLGVDLPVEQSPRAVAQAVRSAARTPGGSRQPELPELAALVRLVEQSRYSPRMPAGESARTPGAAVLPVVRALQDVTSRPRRVRAVVAPRSLADDLGRWWSRLRWNRARPVNVAQ